MDEIDAGVILAVTIICIIVIGLVCSYNHRFNYWRNRSIPHLKPTIPRGNMQKWLYTKHSAEVFEETYSAYIETPILFAGFYLNTQKAAIALKLNFIQSVLEDTTKSFENRGFFHNEKDDPLTGNLFLLDGPKWATLKRKLMPTFEDEKMKYIFPTMLIVGDELQKAFSDEIFNHGGGTFDVTSLLKRFSCDVMSNCVLGLDCNSLKNSKINFHVTIKKFFKTPRHYAVLDSLIHRFPEWAKHWGMKVIPQNITNYFMELLAKVVEHRAQFRVDKRNYFDVLLQANQQQTVKLTTEELAAQAFAYIITGYDTCASTLACALYELARSPQIQNKLREEIRKIFAAHRYKLTYETLRRMTYLDQVISETLRKYPVMPALYRKCTKLYEPFPGSVFYIEEGCLVIIPTFSIHRDANYYPNPEIFDPERFSPANIRNILPYTYLPFGSGQRSCIGERFARMQLCVGLFKLITNYKFEMCPKTRVPIKFFVRSFNISPKDVTLKVTKL